MYKFFHFQKFRHCGEITNGIVMLTFFNIKRSIILSAAAVVLNAVLADPPTIISTVLPYFNEFEAVHADEFPFNVYIVGTNGNCSGSLIAKNLVLTAAHCLRRYVTTKREDKYTIIENMYNLFFKIYYTKHFTPSYLLEQIRGATSAL